MSQLIAALEDLAELRSRLDAGALVDAPDLDGRTALHHAVQRGLVAQTTLLLERGANPNARDAREAMPLHLALSPRDDDDALAVAKLLLEAGADPRAKNGQGFTPAQLGYASDVQAYLQREAKRKPRPSFKPADSPSRAALQSDLERRIDDACRVILRVTATHDVMSKRAEPLLVYRTAKLEFARINRPAKSLDVRDGEAWRPIPYSELPENLNAVIEASVRVSRARRIKTADAMKPHPILKGAIEKARDEEKPSEPIHLGKGPQPVCPSLAAAALTVWMAEHALGVSHPADEAAARDVLALVADGAATYATLLKASTDQRTDSAAMGVARRAAGAAATLKKGKHDVVWVHAKGAAGRVVALLRDASDDPELVTAFIRELDRRILVAEMASSAVRNAKAEAHFEVARVLWRGPDLFVGQLPDERFALVGKLGAKGKWTLVLGTRDDVLASVPDFAFEDATAAFA